MRSRTAAVQLPGWSVLQAKWLTRAVPAALCLIVAALVVQPPVQSAPAVPAKADPVLFARAEAHPSQSFSVIVRETVPSSTAAEDLVQSLGGHVTHELSIVGGFSATVPGSAVGDLTASSVVWRVWGDAPIHMTTDPGPSSAPSNTVWRQAIGLTDPSLASYKGTGVGVALVDTGVVPVPDLGNHIVHVVDLTAEHDGFDRFGHGTHMAGIIAGDGTSSAGQYAGVAPGANLISVKVAGLDGSTDVSIVMAALQWVVTHRAQYNIRVLNLSFGTDSRQSYSVDPLDYAVEQAWRAGIFVVVAAGNRGPSSGTISKPGDDPYVLTVGAANLNGTVDRNDDFVADFSSRGPTQDNLNKPDVFAPGISIVSTRDPGSVIDTQFPSARVGDAYFKGTGTSQATAVMAGLAADLLQAFPSTNNDTLKAAMMGSIQSIKDANGSTGLIRADVAYAGLKSSKFYNKANRGLVPSSGTGSLEASRGTMHVYVMKCETTTSSSTSPSSDPASSTSPSSDPASSTSPSSDPASSTSPSAEPTTTTSCNPVLLTGEVDALGNAWSGNAWSGNAWSGNAWSGNAWSGVAWEGNAWSGNAWSGNAWSGNAWSGTSWSGNAWSGNAWSGNAWSGNAWSGNAWSGGAWSGNAWSGNAWSGNAWSANAWSANAWSANAWSANAWSANAWSSDSWS